MSLSWAEHMHNHHNTQNVDSFTARDFQVELLASAFEKNMVVCIEDHNAKDFITLKLISELGPRLRNTARPQTVLYILNDIRKAETVSFISHLIDLQVAILPPETPSPDETATLIQGKHILISNSETILLHLQNHNISMDSVCLIVLDDCHLQIGRSRIETIVDHFYTGAKRKPKILGLSDSVYGANCLSSQLEAKLQYLEQCLRSTIETASDANNNNSARCLSAKPFEFLVQCEPPSLDCLTRMMIEIVQSKIAFLEDHRFDPLEIYSDEFVDDWKNVPDPKVLPLSLLNEFLDILLDLGPYTAKKAALHFIVQIEKFKIKTAYERHFLLLSLASSVFHQIRMLSDYFMRDVAYKERITNYTTPKVQNLLRALKQFQPKVVDNGNKEKLSHDATETKALTNGETSQEAVVTNQIANLDSLNISGLVSKIVEVQEKIDSTIESPDSNEIKTTLESLLTNANSSSTNNKPTASKPTATADGRPIRPKRRFFNRHRGFHGHQNQDSDSLCGLVFCDSKNIAKALFSVVHEAATQDPELKFLSVQYTTEKCASVDVVADVKEFEVEHRKQEEVLKRFRSRECNLLISTSILESGIDLPKCNLVVRWNVPKSYRSYVLTKGKANFPNAVHVIMISPVFTKKPLEFDKFSNGYHDFVCKSEPIKEDETEDAVSLPEADKFDCPMERYLIDTETVTGEVTEQLAEFFEVESILARSKNSPRGEVTNKNSTDNAEMFNELMAPYRATATSPCSATLLNSIHLINNYCAKLPSDTFTKLVPLVRFTQTTRNTPTGPVTLHQCTIRLPINSSLKGDIVGPPAPTVSLAGRMAALLGCKMLHRSGELDDNLQPIGKEEFRAAEVYFKNFELDQADHQLVKENAEPRPGTTKRRQYYYKKVASALKDCRPVSGQRVYLYHIRMVLRTPIPEEQNTRGRRIFAPEDCPLGFGILTTKRIPKLCPFPIFTRSGEIEVSLELANDNLTLSEVDIQKINHFIRYTFTNVLRLQKYLMFFDEAATENCLYIVPTVEEGRLVRIDQQFLDLIYEQPSTFSKFKSDWTFDEATFQDAVVMPWYRNQDQPQFFYVAEICRFLSPESNFPGTSYATFKEYYYKKYNIEVQNTSQPLLDVDHTSARLNFLTPRYVNRKGVALPTSSEETKRAKRENLEQKQILIPELCMIHPFPASLWRAAVCLPCILYRVNALLLADEIRLLVAEDLGLGQSEMAEKEWPILNFGWSLQELLKDGGERMTLDGPGMLLDCSELEKEEEDVIGEGDNGSDADVEEGNGEDDDVDDEDKLEIGTWNNEMAKSLYETTEDKLVRYGSPTQWDRTYTNDEGGMPSYFSDSDSSFQSDDNYNEDAMIGNNPANAVESFDPLDDLRLRIKFESNNVAEAFESEATIANRNKFYHQLEYPEASTEEPFDIRQIEESPYFNRALIEEFGEKKRRMVDQVKESHLIRANETLDLVTCRAAKKQETTKKNIDLLAQLFPYLSVDAVVEYLREQGQDVDSGAKLTLDNYFDLNELYFKLHPLEQDVFSVSTCGDVFDRFEGSFLESLDELKDGKNREVSLRFSRGNLEKRNFRRIDPVLTFDVFKELHKESRGNATHGFSFDYQPNLIEHPGPSPSIILQALTMSNANDGINLERLETIGDSFLKFAITTYLYCTYEHVHEGKLSHLRSKYVSNLNLYRLGRVKKLGELMISTKFEPHDNWLPPCYYTPKGLEKVLIEAQIPIFYWNLADLQSLKEKSNYEICQLIQDRAVENGFVPQVKLRAPNQDGQDESGGVLSEDTSPCFIPYNLVNQHSIPDKSIADCVEALIGSYLIDCGPRGALLFMSWAGICVLPHSEIEYSAEWKRYPGSGPLIERDGKTYRKVFGSWMPPKSPSFDDQRGLSTSSFDYALEGFRSFEKDIGYKFNDPLYLLQAMTHASYSPNRLTDCYQRLEFLGDAVLDYLITRHLFEDPRQHSPGALTDLRSALVNNTIFASLAVRHGFHKHFRHLSSGLHQVIDRFVRIQHENGYTLSEECYLILEDAEEEAEDVEVPKALGDLFESVAGAIFLDSGMSLDAVWKVYEKIMGPEIEKFSNSVPKSPIRELLELEPETAKFGKPEKLADGRRVRVVVEIFGKGTFHGIGRNYRIAKCTAAKCALRHLKRTRC